jgi:hypothetical protein
MRTQQNMAMGCCCRGACTTPCSAKFPPAPHTHTHYRELEFINQVRAFQIILRC